MILALASPFNVWANHQDQTLHNAITASSKNCRLRHNKEVLSFNLGYLH